MKTIIISDTHHQHEELVLPEADMIIHCGDFSDSKNSLDNFLDWFSSLNIEYKILVAGNHDKHVQLAGKEAFKARCNVLNINYLEDDSIIIEGIKFYGSPWTPLFFNFSFMLYEQALAVYWDKIPLDTQVLITHGPQKGTLDKVPNYSSVRHVGSSSLAKKIVELKELKFHFFGHIHGETNLQKPNNSQKYTSVNAAMVYEWNERISDVKLPILLTIN